MDKAELPLLLFASLLGCGKAGAFAFDVGRSRFPKLTAVLTLRDWPALLCNGKEFSLCAGIVQRLATIFRCFQRGEGGDKRKTRTLPSKL